MIFSFGVASQGFKLLHAAQRHETSVIFNSQLCTLTVIVYLGLGLDRIKKSLRRLEVGSASTVTYTASQYEQPPSESL
jgi:hypothetical protein